LAAQDEYIDRDSNMTCIHYIQVFIICIQMLAAENKRVRSLVYPFTPFIGPYGRFTRVERGGSGLRLPRRPLSLQHGHGATGRSPPRARP
jgi:hypothetical protein